MSRDKNFTRPDVAYGEMLHVIKATKCRPTAKTDAKTASISASVLAPLSASIYNSGPDSPLLDTS
jgi:hypothetical protein